MAESIIIFGLAMGGLAILFSLSVMVAEWISERETD